MSPSDGSDGNGGHSGNGGIHIGANPIIWSNDDFQDLGGEIPLEQCLEEMRTAGFAGSELGHKYPRDPGLLGPLLRKYDLQLISGWHSLTLLDEAFDRVKHGFLDHLEFLQRMGSPVIIVAECSRRVYHDPAEPLRFEQHHVSGAERSAEHTDARNTHNAQAHTPLSEHEWDRLTIGLDALAEITRCLGMRLVYHHHMGTVIQNEDEIDQLMARTRIADLLVDTGHLAFAGVDPVRILQRYRGRIGHVHLKDVRRDVVESARRSRASFATAVRNGVFTVPGDGDVDFAAVFAALREIDYSGWLVVEAEQDPKKSPPLQYARMGRKYIEHALGV